MDGLGGLVRLHFVLGEYHECIETFRRGCPPHGFYLRYRELLRGGPVGDGMAAFNRLTAQYPRTSPYFLSHAKYMRQAIVTAAVMAGGIDETLRGMISDYFEIEVSQVDALAKVTADSEEELARLRKRLAPKAIAMGRSLDSLKAEGNTERTRQLVARVPRSAGFVEAAGVLLDGFLESGNPVLLDEMVVAASPFGIAAADGLVLAEALASRHARIVQRPAHRLTLLRRFSAVCRCPPVCRYPMGDFLSDYLDVMREIRADVEPGDVLAAILDLQWYKTPYRIDNIGPMGVRGGLGKPEISDHREWIEIMLRDHSAVLDRSQFTDREKAIGALHRAYLFLRERFHDVRRNEHWVGEAQLGEALRALFGKEEVQRHARPLWLRPQHLDYLLPRYALAVEYMGPQHYEPVEWFGGSQGLASTKARDERKRSLCQRMGVSLAYVAHSDDTGRRAKEIFTQYAGGRGGTSIAR